MSEIPDNNDIPKYSKDFKYNLRLILVIVLVILLIIFYIPITINDNKCYDDIRQEMCTNRTVVVNTYDIGTFSCCDYSKTDNTSRKWQDRMPNCESYLFLEEDYDKCSYTKSVYDLVKNAYKKKI